MNSEYAVYVTSSGRDPCDMPLHVQEVDSKRARPDDPEPKRSHHAAPAARSTVER